MKEIWSSAQNGWGRGRGEISGNKTGGGVLHNARRRLQRRVPVLEKPSPAPEKTSPGPSDKKITQPRKTTLRQRRWGGIDSRSRDGETAEVIPALALLLRNAIYIIITKEGRERENASSSPHTCRSNRAHRCAGPHEPPILSPKRAPSPSRRSPAFLFFFLFPPQKSIRREKGDSAGMASPHPAVLILLLIATAAMFPAVHEAASGTSTLESSFTVGELDGGMSCVGSECYYNDEISEDDVEGLVVDDGNGERRQLLARRRRFLSYDMLKRNQVPCNRRGASYYNCLHRGKANPYRRGCSYITRCARDLH
ncbi:hypothetical protein KSP40_PGU021301 [Platanthera guangdongensis]|uniref:Rapid alkalinization factor n=1 Tax=Platanthera guangdongensis TaxID=2320717 RepID=A0ABR2LF61_9ASPA